MQSKNITKSIDELYSVITNGKFENILVSFSGGKDSTATLQLLIDTIVKFELYYLNVKLISSDTRIENPMISSELKNKIEQFHSIFNSLGVKNESKIVYPDYKHSFFYLTIGKGYATPQNRMGRWCTKELKIVPIKNTYDSIDRKTLILTGVRDDESAARANSIKKFFTNSLERASEYIYYYPPIRNINITEVWDYLTDFTRTDNHYLDNKNLWDLYVLGTRETMCPSSLDLMYSDIKSNCGKSRYGCYLCPLTKKSAITANYENGQKHLLPYVEVRNFYIENSSKLINRRRYNRRNSIKLKEVEIVEQKVSYKLLDNSVRGLLDEFRIIRVDTTEEVRRFILNIGESYNSYLGDKKDVLFIINSKYFVCTTSTLTLEFRKEFLNYVCEIENKYNVNIICDEEKDLILGEMYEES